MQLMTHISADDFRNHKSGSGGILENNVPGLKGGHKTIFDPSQAKKTNDENSSENTDGD